MPIAEILVVDDDRQIREPLSLLLTAAGYSVSLAGDGEDAIVQVRAGRCRPSVVILDLDMPRMDGRGFLGALKLGVAAAAVSPSQVILISASPDVAEVAAEHRVARYFGKPFDFEQLLNAIGALVARSA